MLGHNVCFRLRGYVAYATPAPFEPWGIAILNKSTFPEMREEPALRRVSGETLRDAGVEPGLPDVFYVERSVVQATVNKVDYSRVVFLGWAAAFYFFPVSGLVAINKGNFVSGRQKAA